MRCLWQRWNAGLWFSGVSININNDTCGGFSKNDPHRPICLNAWAIVSGTVWEGLGGVALEEVRHRDAWTLNFQKPTPGQVLHSLSLSLPAVCGSDVSSQLLLQHHAYWAAAKPIGLLPCLHAPHPDDCGLTL